MIPIIILAIIAYGVVGYLYAKRMNHNLRTNHGYEYETTDMVNLALTWPYRLFTLKQG